MFGLKPQKHCFQLYTVGLEYPEKRFDQQKRLKIKGSCCLTRIVISYRTRYAMMHELMYNLYKD